MRSLKLKVKAEKIDMDGVQVDQALPIMMLKHVDPFILIHHWKEVLPGQQRQKDVGVGPHPHRGFSPVTVIFEGGIHHRDSLGNSEVIEAGGVQWMNAGKGITHSERPSKTLAEKGGEMEIIQFWVNIPAVRKNDPASYQPLKKEHIPEIIQDGGKSRIQLIAGALFDRFSPIKTASPLLILRLDVKQGGEVEIPVSPDYELLIYVLSGEIELPDENKGHDKELLWFRNDGQRLVLKANKETRAIFLAGKAIKEPIFSHGPFVLNDENEVMPAIRDYQMGKMGILIEDFD
jgi:redox-sensitive bicupin YhaK (pirin superfamily)